MAAGRVPGFHGDRHRQSGDADDRQLAVRDVRGCARNFRGADLWLYARRPAEVVLARRWKVVVVPIGSTVERRGNRHLRRSIRRQRTAAIAERTADCHGSARCCHRRQDLPDRRRREGGAAIDRFVRFLASVLCGPLRVSRCRRRAAGDCVLRGGVHVRGDASGEKRERASGQRQQGAVQQTRCRTKPRFCGQAP